MRTAVGSVKMQPPCESPALATVAAVMAADCARRCSPSAREPGRKQLPVPPRPRLRDLPALLRSGLILRRKRGAAGGRIYGENSSCAGRVLQDIIIIQAADLIKDRVNLKGFYRRSCIGSELVDWLLEHCPFIQCRSMAIGVWQLLLDMGILSSVDQHLYFQDTYVFYQISSDECNYLYWEFEGEEAWQNGVRLLLQLVPLIPSRAGICELLAGKFLKSNYLFVAIGQVGGACTDVQQTILQVGQYSKREKLVEILQNIGDERTMVFVETRKKADFIASFLCQENISTTSIHGDREQREREQALGDFRCGKCPVLVATSVAARGLDIENVQHVINFDLPSTIDEYVHRIGRTGRCGNTGRAISFFDLESDSHLAQPLVKVLYDAQQDVPAWLEEIALSTHGPGFSGRTRGNVFASVDTRKNYHGRSSLNTAGFSSSQAPNPVDDESWD